jgi:excisionase family DNA binding protein
MGSGGLFATKDQTVSKRANNYAPRALRAEEAATYLGMGRSKFLQLVDEGRLPKPRAVDSMRLWDRFALDAAFDDFTEPSDGGRPNSFDQILGAG